MILWFLITGTLFAWNVSSFLNRRSMKLPFRWLLGWVLFSFAMALIGPSPDGHD